MNMDAVIIYSSVVFVSLGILLALFFRFRDAVSDLDSKITGIWSNEANTIRILIYSIDSHFQAEVIWTRNIDQEILGSAVIRNLSLKYFSWGEGTYVDPFTKDQFHFKLKLKNEGQLNFYIEKSGRGYKTVEAWKQVSQPVF